jgi:hypothetical protein
VHLPYSRLLRCGNLARKGCISAIVSGGNAAPPGYKEFLMDHPDYVPTRARQSHPRTSVVTDQASYPPIRRFVTGHEARRHYFSVPARAISSTRQY